MAYNFIPCDRNQAYLLPPSLSDWLPQNHLAWFILDVIRHIDLQPFYAKYRADGIGNSAFDPSMMAVLLVYAYSTGEGCRGRQGLRQGPSRRRIAGRSAESRRPHGQAQSLQRAAGT